MGLFYTPIQYVVPKNNIEYCYGEQIHNINFSTAHEYLLLQIKTMYTSAPSSASLMFTEHLYYNIIPFYTK